MSAVPAIDLDAWFHGDQADRRAVAGRVDAALRESGFLVVTGHGDAARPRRDHPGLTARRVRSPGVPPRVCLLRAEHRNRRWPSRVRRSGGTPRLDARSVITHGQVLE